MRVRDEIQTRFCDTDMIGHINNTAIAQYAEIGRVGYFEAAELPPRTMIIARLEIDFVAQMHHGRPAWIETWTERVGRTSIGLAQSVYSDGVEVARIRAVGVYFDYERNVPREVPDELRARLLSGERG